MLRPEVVSFGNHMPVRSRTFIALLLYFAPQIMGQGDVKTERPKMGWY